MEGGLEQPVTPALWTRVESREFRRSVVRVGNDTGTTLGTGFAVAPEWILTAAHVVKDLDQVIVVAEEDRDWTTPMAVEVVARSDPPARAGELWPFPDLAILRTADPLNLPSVLLGPHEPVGDRECHAWGFPRYEGLEAKGSPAAFAFEGFDADDFLQLKSGQAAPGLSGAPLVCPTRRAVIGVMTATRDAQSDLGGWASPVSALLLGGRGVPEELARHGEEIRRANRLAVLTERRRWHRVLPIEGAMSLLRQPWAELGEHPHRSPSSLLRADFGVVRYRFRDRELDAMVRWCEQPMAMAVTRVPGRGGTGKTRFAIELCKRMIDRGWCAGLLRDNAIAQAALPRLIVIDYAEAVDPTVLQDLLERLQSQATEIAPVRVLMLTRIAAGGASDPLRTLHEQAAAVLEPILAASEEQTDATSGLSQTQRRDLYEQALVAFREAWPHSVETAADVDLSAERYATPLDVLFEAFDRALAGTPDAASSRRPPVERALTHEQRYWSAAAGQLPQLDRELQAQCVALATLAQAADEQEAHGLLSLLPGLQGEEAAALRTRAIKWLGGLYDGPLLLNPLRPDRLGETLVADVLRAFPGEDARLLSAVARLPSDDQVTRCLDLLARLAAVDEPTADATTRMLAELHVELVDRADRQARGLPDRPGRLALANELLRHFASERGHDIAQACPADTVSQRALSISYAQLGELAHDNGRPDEAHSLYRRSLTVAELVADAAPDDAIYKRDLSIAIERVGDVARRGGRPAEADRLYRRALAVREQLAGADPDDTTHQHDLSISYERLGELARDTGRPHDADRLYRQALTIAETITAAEPENAAYQRGLAVSYNKLGDLAHESGHLQDTTRLYRRSLAVREQLTQAYPDNSMYQRDLSISYARLGDLARDTGHPHDADRLYRQALAITETIAKAEPQNTAYKRDLSLIYNKLGDLARNSGLLDEADRLYRLDLAIAEELAQIEPQNTTYKRDLAISYTRLGDLARDNGLPDEADRLYRQVLAIGEALAQIEPQSTTYKRDLSVAYNKLGGLARDSGLPDEADRLYRQDLAIAEELTHLDPQNTTYQRDLSISYMRLGDLARDGGVPDEAERLYRQAVQIGEAITKAERQSVLNQRSLAVACNKLGDLARDTGLLDEAERLYRQVLAIAETITEADPANTIYQRDLSVACERLGRIAQARDRLSDAEAWFAQAATTRQALVRREPARVDLAEELSVVLALLAGAMPSPTSKRELRDEAIQLLAPFERAGTLSAKGTWILDWARSE